MDVLVFPGDAFSGVPDFCSTVAFFWEELAAGFGGVFLVEEAEVEEFVVFGLLGVDFFFTGSAHSGTAARSSNASEAFI